MVPEQLSFNSHERYSLKEKIDLSQKYRRTNSFRFQPIRRALNLRGHVEI